MISGSIYIHDRVGDWETLKLTQHNLLLAINRIGDLIDVDGVVPPLVWIYALDLVTDMNYYMVDDRI